MIIEGLVIFPGYKIFGNIFAASALVYQSFRLSIDLKIFEFSDFVFTRVLYLSIYSLVLKIRNIKNITLVTAKNSS